MNQQDLLEQLTSLVGCSYVSDLRNELYYDRLITKLKKLCPTNYSVTQWRETISYLTHESLDFYKQSDYIEYLIHYLTNHSEKEQSTS